MAIKSVVQIDVDDAAFKRFQGLFTKYQEALTKMPGQWGKLDKGVQATGASFLEMTAALLAQAEILKGTTKETERQEKNVSRMAGNWRDMARQSKDYAKNLTSATRELLRWVGITSLFAGLFSGGAFLGLDRLALGAAGARKSATGLGVTPAQQKAFETSYGHMFDTNSLLGKVAEAKNDLNQRWLFSALGVSGVDQKGNVELAQEVADQARKRYQQNPRAAANMPGLKEFFGLDELRRLGAATPGDMDEARRTNSERQKSIFNVSDDALKNWTRFTQAMSAAGDKIEAVFVRQLEGLTPGLVKLTDAVADSVDSLLGSDGFKKLIDEAGVGLKQFAAWVGGPTFQQDIKDFAKGVGDIVRAIANAVKWFEQHFGPSEPVQRPGETPGDALRRPRFAPRISNPGDQVMNDLMKGGLSRAEAAAFAGNFSYESAGFNTGRQANGSYGIASWRGGRQQDLLSGAYGDPGSLSAQTKFTLAELSGKEKKTLDLLRMAEARGASQQELSAIVMRSYERPSYGDQLSSVGARQREAVRFAAAPTNVVISNNTGGNAVVATSQNGVPQ